MNITHPQAQKERELMKERKAEQFSALATGEQMAENLKLYAEKKSIAPDHPIIWDGREESIPQVVAETVRHINDQPVQRPELKKKAPVIGPTIKKKK